MKLFKVLALASLVAAPTAAAAQDFGAPSGAPPPSPEPAATTAPAPAPQPEVKTEATVEAQGAVIQQTEAPAVDEKIGLAIAPKVGGIIPTSDLGGTFYLGLDVSYRLPVLSRLLGVALDFGYAQPAIGGTIADPALGNVDYDLDQRLFIFGLEAFATLPLEKVDLYGGLGYGVYVLRAKTVALGDTNTESQVRSGTQIRGGAGLHVGPGSIFGELRYHYVGLEFLSTGESNAGGFTLAAGYRFAF